LIYGDGIEEANRISNRLSVRFLKWQNLIGGIISRQIVQRISSQTYPRTAETCLFLYTCVFFALLYLLDECLEDSPDETKRDFFNGLMNGC